LKFQSASLIKNANISLDGESIIRTGFNQQKNHFQLSIMRPNVGDWLRVRGPEDMILDVHDIPESGTIDLMYGVPEKPLKKIPLMGYKKQSLRLNQ